MSNYLRGSRKSPSSVAGFALFLISFALRCLIPANVQLNSPHDDLLSIQLSEAISRGHWLGAWNNRTLLKPFGYSLFVSFDHIFGLSPVIAICLIYLVLSWYLSNQLLLLSKLAGNRLKTHRNFAFGILALNPNLFSSDMSRVYRSSLNVVSLMALTCVLIKVWDLYKSTLPTRGNKNELSALRNKLRGLFVLLGGSYFIAYDTRIESYWLLLPFACIAILVFLKNIISHNVFSILKRGSRDRLFLVSSLWGILAFFIPLVLVESVNQNLYGAKIFDDYAHGEFPRSLNLWSSVINGKVSDISVYVSAGQRKAVYEVSPAAKSLEAFLEVPPSQGWKTFYCQTGGNCNEFGSAWFPFALRDAATQAAHITNEAQFQAFFKTLSDEIEIACKSKRIMCGHEGSGTGIPYIGELPARKIFSEIGRSLSYYYSPDQNYNFNLNNEHGDKQLIDYWKMTASVNPLSKPKISAEWLAAYSYTYAWFVRCLTMLILITLVLNINGARRESMLLLNVPLMGSLFLFSLGTAILSLSWGFPANLSFYDLPGFPIFLTIILLNYFAAISLIEKRLVRRKL